MRNLPNHRHHRHDHFDIKKNTDVIKVIWDPADLQQAMDALKASGWGQPKPKRIKIVTEFKKFTTCPERGHWEMIRRGVEE